MSNEVDERCTAAVRRADAANDQSGLGVPGTDQRFLRHLRRKERAVVEVAGPDELAHRGVRVEAQTNRGVDGLLIRGVSDLSAGVDDVVDHGGHLLERTSRPLEGGANPRALRGRRRTGTHADGHGVQPG